MSTPSRSPRGIKVTVLDHQNGDIGEREIEPGDYCIVVADPLYLAGIQKHGNGTIVLTLKLA
jgi:hypothetical protein